MGKVFKGNLFFLIVMIYMMIGIFPLVLVVKIFNISDFGLLLLIQHVFLIILPGIIYLIIAKEPVKEILRLNKLNLRQIGLIIGIALMSQPIMTFFSLISSFFFKNEVAEAIGSMADKPYILLLAIISLLPSISEELILRGIVLNGYEKKHRYVGALMTGIMFGLFHLNYHQFLYAAVMGFILGLVVIVTNSIYASMIIHFIINGISVTMMKVTNLLPSVETLEELGGTTITVKDNIISTALIFVVALICFIIVKKLFKKLRIESNYVEITKEEEDKESVINIPFIGSIIVFVIYMVIL